MASTTEISKLTGTELHEMIVKTLGQANSASECANTDHSGDWKNCHTFRLFIATLTALAAVEHQGKSKDVLREAMGAQVDAVLSVFTFLRSISTFERATDVYMVLSGTKDTDDAIEYTLNRFIDSVRKK